MQAIDRIARAQYGSITWAGWDARAAFRSVVQGGRPPGCDLPAPGRALQVRFAYPELLLASEVDGYGPHAARKAFQDDRDRQNVLVGLGWTVLRFTGPDVVKRPEYVARLVADTIGKLQSATALWSCPNGQGDSV